MTMTMTMMFSSCLLVHWERLVPTCSLVCALRTLLFKGPIFIPGKFLPTLHHEIFRFISPGMINVARPIAQRPVGLTKENENDTFTADRTGPTVSTIFFSFNSTIDP